MNLGTVVTLFIFGLNVILGIANAITKEEKAGWICSALGWTCAIIYVLAYTFGK